ncbi:mechanosensitive ion channel family protein [Cellulomonas cellasea]|uniref:mechanosensitive ion channel family protein n=1 Tax=Cellulomonas cellasea TaxID=43670 RepID=UPI001FEA56C7|nr:mechanosensitive ion channel family protein [Cellulomonas cellasea]
MDAVNARTLLAAGATPEPTETTPADMVREANAAMRWLLETGFPWLLSTGLRVAVILTVAGLVLLGLRRVIRTVTNHIAEGTPLLERGRLGDSEVAAALRRASPIVTARRAQRARTIGSVLRSTATIVVGTLAVLMVLDALGANIAPFIASAGIVGVALGFGAQSLVKDFLSGMFMLLEDQYGVGDVVDVGHATGTVEAVALRVTKIRDSSGTLWYVPNGTMVRVGNKTQGWAKAVVEVKVDYFADLDEVRHVLEEAVGRVAADPVLGTYLEGEPTVTGIEDLAFDAVTLQVTVKTAPAMQWEVARAMRAAVRRALEEAGIPLGGQRDLLAAYRAQLDAAVRVPEQDEADAPGAGGKAEPVTDTRRESESLDTTAPATEPKPRGR